MADPERLFAPVQPSHPVLFRQQSRWRETPRRLRQARGGSRAGSFEISIEAIRAIANPEPEWGYQSARWFRSTLNIKANEVVDVTLPPQDDQRGTPTDR